MKTAEDRPTIEAEIVHVLRKLKELEPETEAYAKAVSNLEGLCKARSYKRDSKIPWEILITVVASSLQLLTVLNFEKIDVLSQKALGWVLRVSRI